MCVIVIMLKSNMKLLHKNTSNQMMVNRSTFKDISNTYAISNPKVDDNCIVIRSNKLVQNTYETGYRERHNSTCIYSTNNLSKEMLIIKDTPIQSAPTTLNKKQKSIYKSNTKTKPFNLSRSNSRK